MFTHQQPVVSPQDVADELGWPVEKVRDAVRRGQLRSHKLGGRHLIDRASAERFVKEQRETTAKLAGIYLM